MKSFAQGHRAGKEQSWGENLDLLDTKINANSSHICHSRSFRLLSQMGGACTGLKQHSRINLRLAPGQPPA